MEDFGEFFPEECASAWLVDSWACCFLYEYCQRDAVESAIANFEVVLDKGRRSERIVEKLGDFMHDCSLMLLSFCSSTRKNGYLLRKRDALLHFVCLFFNISDISF